MMRTQIGAKDNFANFHGSCSSNEQDESGIITVPIR